MTKLFTYHDPYRIHAVSGALSLMHFIYRIQRIVRYGTAFNGDTYTVFVHALLYASAYIPHIPSKRNLTSPMIWPEFRIHNTIFGLRHILCTYVEERRARYGLVFLSMYLADLTTEQYGSQEVRTTNAMPYPAISETDIKNTKDFYASAQFHATTYAALGNTTLCFYPLLAIQLSPLLMTLVRKSLISSYAYHLVYTLALLSMYPIVFMHLNPSCMFTGYFSHIIRTYTKTNKYILWAVLFALNQYDFQHWIFDYTHLLLLYCFLDRLYSIRWMVTHLPRHFSYF